MACGSCDEGAAVGARAAQKWIYQSPKGIKTETASQAEANTLVTINGGGQVYPKP